MPTKKIAAVVCFVGVLALIAIPFSISCIGDEAEPTVLEVQEPIEVPMVVEVESSSWCDDCVRKPVQKVLDRKVLRRVVVERPAVETYVQVTRERRLRRQPVRSFVRRLFCR